jgi:hypothetical protein
VADEKDEIAFSDFESDVIEGVNAVGIDQRDAAEGDHRCRRVFPEPAAYTSAP